MLNLLIDKTDNSREKAFKTILDDPANSIQESLDFDNITASLILKAWLDDNPEKAGKLLFQLIDSYHSELTELYYQQD